MNNTIEIKNLTSNTQLTTIEAKIIVIRKNDPLPPFCNVHEKLRYLLEKMKKEYGDQWSEYLKAHPPPTFKSWEITKLRTFLTTSIPLKKKHIDFNCRFSISDIYKNRPNKNSPFFLRGSSLNHFLLYTLHFFCPIGKLSYIERHLAQFCFKNKKTLLDMFSKEEIKALCEKFSPSDYDLLSIEEYLGDQNSLFLQHLASKIDSSLKDNFWYKTKINLEIIKTQKDSQNLPDEIKKLKNRFIRVCGLNNFCSNNFFQLISFGNNGNLERRKNFDVVFIQNGIKNRRNTIFKQGALRLNLNICFNSNSAEFNLSPTIEKEDSLSASECLFEELKSNLEPAYPNMIEQDDLIIAKIKEMKKYTSDFKDLDLYLFKNGFRKDLQEDSQKLRTELEIITKRGCRNHLDDHPVKSMILLYHLCIFFEDLLKPEDLCLLVKEISSNWDLSDIPYDNKNWIFQLHSLLKSGCSFSLLHNFLQIAILWHLYSHQDGSSWIKLTQHQGLLAAQLTVPIDKENFCLVIPLNIDKAIEKILDLPTLPQEMNTFLEPFFSNVPSALNPNKSLFPFLKELKIPLQLPELTSTTFPQHLVRLTLMMIQNVHPSLRSKTIKTWVAQGKDMPLQWREVLKKILCQLLQGEPYRLAEIKAFKATSFLDQEVVAKKDWYLLWVKNIFEASKSEAFRKLSLHLLLSPPIEIEEVPETISAFIETLAKDSQELLALHLLEKSQQLTLQNLQKLLQNLPSSKLTEITIKKIQKFSCKVINASIDNEAPFICDFILLCNTKNIDLELPLETHEKILKYLLNETSIEVVVKHLSLPYQKLWKEKLGDLLCELYQQHISTTPWKAAKKLISAWSSLDPQALKNKSILSPLKDLCLTYELANEIFSITKDSDSILYQWVDFELKNLALNQPTAACEILDKLPFENVNKMITIDVLIDNFSKKESPQELKKALQLTTVFRSDDKTRWKHLFQSENMELRKILLNAFLHDDKIKKIFAVEKELWNLAFQSLLNTPSYLSEAIKIALDKINENMRQKESSFAEYIISLEELAITLWKKENLQLCEKSKKLITSINSLLLKRKELKSFLSLNASLFLLMTYQNTKISIEALPLLKNTLSSKKLCSIMPLEAFGNFNQIFLLCKDNEIQEITSLFIISGLYEKLNLPLKCKFWSALSQHLTSTFLETLTYEYQEVIIKIFLVNAEEIIKEINKKQGTSLAQWIAKITVQGFFAHEKESALLNTTKEKISSVSSSLKNFPFELSLCQELSKKLNSIPQASFSNQHLRASTKLITLIMSFVENKQHLHHVAKLFGDALMLECSFEKKPLQPLIEKIYELGKKEHLFDENNKEQIFLHAAYRNSCEMIPIPYSKKNLSSIVNFLEHLVDKSHSSYFERTIFLLDYYNNLDAKILVPLYQNLLVKLKGVKIKEKEPLYKKIFENIKNLQNSSKEDTFICLLEKFVPKFFQHLKKTYKPLVEKEPSNIGEILCIQKHLLRVENLVDFSLNRLKFSEHYDVLYPIFTNYYSIVGDIIEYISIYEATILKFDRIHKWEKKPFIAVACLFQQETKETDRKKRNDLLFSWMNRMSNIKTSNPRFWENLKKLFSQLDKKNIFDKNTQSYDSLRKRINKNSSFSSGQKKYDFHIIESPKNKNEEKSPHFFSLQFLIDLNFELKVGLAKVIFKSLTFIFTGIWSLCGKKKKK